MQNKDSSCDSNQLSQLLSDYIQDQRNKKRAEEGMAKNRLQQESGSGGQPQFDGFYECVGMLKALWRNKKTNRPEYIDYGTAFAVSPRIILTCTHNIYHEDGGTIADQIVFVPSHKGYITPSTPTFHSLRGEYCQFIMLEKGDTLKEVPTVNELCLIALSQPIKCNKYVKVGLYEPKAGECVEVIGFPSKKYAGLNNLLSVCLNRVHLRGKITSVQGDIINHDLLTKVGHSGSAILYQTPNKQVVAIGIHTHRGNAFENRGLFFNKEVVNKIKQFQKIFVPNLCSWDLIKYQNDQFCQLYQELQLDYKQETQKSIQKFQTQEEMKIILQGYKGELCNKENQGSNKNV